MSKKNIIIASVTVVVLLVGMGFFLMKMKPTSNVATKPTTTTKPRVVMKEVILNISEEKSQVTWTPGDVTIEQNKPTTLKIFNKVKANRCVEIPGLIGRLNVKAESSLMVSFLPTKAGKFTVGCKDFPKDTQARLEVVAR